MLSHTPLNRCHHRIELSPPQLVEDPVFQPLVLGWVVQVELLQVTEQPQNADLLLCRRPDARRSSVTIRERSVRSGAVVLLELLLLLVGVFAELDGQMAEGG